MLSSVTLILSLLVRTAHAASWPDLTTLPAKTGEGKNDAALIVAIEDYAEVDDVRGARENADAWLNWFVGGRGIPASRVFRAYDREAKDHKITELARSAAASVTPGGTLWFVFIGHGAPSRDGKGGLLVGADADRSADGIYKRSVSREELLRILDGGKQASTVALIDACFSGQTSSGASLVDGLQPLVPTSLLVTPSSRSRVLTAAGSGQFSGPLAGAARPAFSYLALGGLMGWADVDGEGNHDGRVSASELRAYVAGALNLTVRGRTQIPVRFGDDGDLGKAIATKAPDLLALGRVETPSAPNATIANVSLSGGDTDFKKLSADIAARTAELKRLEAEQRALDSKLADARHKKLSEAVAALRAKAKSDYDSLAPLLALDALPEDGRAVLAAYVKRYADASVSVEGLEERVDIDEVERVRDALKQKGKASKAKAAERSIEKEEPLPVAGGAARQVLTKDPEALRAEARRARKDAMERLETLLESFDGADEQKAEMRMRLSDLYFEQGRDLFLTEMAKYQDAHDYCANSKTPCNPDSVKVEDYTKGSRVWQNKSIASYKQILTDYPRFARVDEALFFLGQALQDVSRKEEANDTFRKLVSDYPMSNYVTDAYVCMGEYYFDRNEAFKALTNYKRAVDRGRPTKEHPADERYPYALYKLAWCYFSVGESVPAIGAMQHVVLHFMKEVEAGGSGNLQLQEEALKDLARFYASAGDIAGGTAYFTSVGQPERVREMLALQAEHQRQE